MTEALLAFFIGIATFNYSVNYKGPDVFVTLTYPTPGTPIRACTYMHTKEEGGLYDYHCWDVKNPIAEIDNWPNWTMDDLYVITTVQMADGRLYTAAPITENKER